MESKSCKGCIHLRKYKIGGYFCSNSREAKVQSVKDKSAWPFKIVSPSDVSCGSYEKETKD